MDLEAIGALLTPEGWALLESLPGYDETHAITLGERLRREGHSPALVSAALTQSRLRARATAKFGPFAATMLFTPAGLEQATRLSVAARHAQRFTAAGITRVADLGCGIGSDSMALATFDREVLAVERDDVTAAVATMNLRHWPEATVRCEDATTTDLSEVGGAFVDPARRTASGKRLLDPRGGSPPLSFVYDLAHRLPAVGLKTAPGIPHHLVPAQAEAQWVSVAGEVVEAALWFGLTARDGVRRAALVLPSDDDTVTEPAEVTDVDLMEAPVGPVGACALRTGRRGHPGRSRRAGRRRGRGAPTRPDDRLCHVRPRRPYLARHGLRRRGRLRLPAQDPAHLATRPRRGPTDDQEAGYRRGTRSASAAASVERRPRGHDRAHPGERATERPGRAPFEPSP